MQAHGEKNGLCRYVTGTIWGELLFGAVLPAAADQVYHTERLELVPVGGAPLQSGFVVNIHPNGPINFAP